MESGCTILLVEDNADDALFFERMLNTLGFDGELICKENPRAAWNYLNGAQTEAPVPDLIVSDHFLYDNGDSDLLNWLRAHPRYRDVPFIVFTGGITPDHARQFAEKGIMVVNKPPSISEFPQVLRDAFLLLPEHCRPWLKR